MADQAMQKVRVARNLLDTGVEFYLPEWRDPNNTIVRAPIVVALAWAEMEDVMGKAAALFQAHTLLAQVDENNPPAQQVGDMVAAWQSKITEAAKEKPPKASSDQTDLF